MKDIPYRQCCRCSHIEDCPAPAYDDNDKWITPKECPKKEEVKLNLRIYDTLPREYFIDESSN